MMVDHQDIEVIETGLDSTASGSVSTPHEPTDWKLFLVQVSGGRDCGVRGCRVRMCASCMLDSIAVRNVFAITAWYGLSHLSTTKRG